MAKILYFSRNYTVHDQRFLSALAQTNHKVFHLQLENHNATRTRDDQTKLGRRPSLRNEAEGGEAAVRLPLPAGIEPINWAGDSRFSKPSIQKHQNRKKSLTLFEMIALLPELRKVIRDIQPDLIHAGPIQRAAFLVALSGFKPLVSMSWGYDLLFDATKNFLWRWITQYTLKRSTVMIGDCNTIRQIAVAFGMPNEYIITFPWGVDLKQFTPPYPDQWKETRSFSLLSTRNWEPIYGVEIIARAFVQAAQSNSELHLVMLGGGSMEDELRQIFQAGGVLERVTFPGYASQADLPHYYQQADLYISASHSDGSSISLLEALACGCPVLVSDIPGNQEWVEPGVQGWLFPDGDSQGLAQAILEAMADRDRLYILGKSGRKLAEERANWERNFQELLRGYDLALSL